MAKACQHTHHGHRGRLSPFLGVPASSDDSYHQAFLVSVTNLLKEAGRCVYQWRLIQFNAVETKLMSDCQFLPGYQLLSLSCSRKYGLE